MSVDMEPLRMSMSEALPTTDIGVLLVLQEAQQPLSIGRKKRGYSLIRACGISPERRQSSRNVRELRRSGRRRDRPAKLERL